MKSTFTESKESLKQKALNQMDRLLTTNNWNCYEKVALTCQVLADLGHCSGLSGQITTKLDSEIFITQRLGLGFDEITSANLLKVDRDLNVLDGVGMPNPANRFHSWIYESRQDISCVIHTHPPHTSALSMLEQPLTVSHMDTCLIYDDVAFHFDWPGIPVGNNEGKMIAKAIGNKSALLLGHHGLVVVADSIEKALVITIQVEKAAQLQLLAMAAGSIKSINSALALEAREWLSRPKRIAATFDYYARKQLKNNNSSIC